jgi:uncharacterized protein (DUF58 family)
MVDIEPILIRAREEVYTYLNGVNLSKILGEGYDFAELREYQPNDDIRYISWINSAKFQKPYIKLSYEERELNIAIAPLVDGRFAIGDKFKVLTYIVAVLSYSTYVEGGSLLPTVQFGAKFQRGEPTKDMEVIESYLNSLATLKPLGKSIEYQTVPNTLLQNIYDKSLLFLIGDFLDFMDLSILAQKHELVVVIVRDHLDENPPIDIDAQLINPRTNQNIAKVASRSAIRHYRAKLREHDERLLTHLNSLNIRYIKIYSLDEVVGKLRYLTNTLAKK